MAVRKAPQTHELLALMREPATYPERPAHVEVRETHISWVFLTDQCAYKLKKPVKFEFLDFSTAEARKLACCEEVRLNRRLAHDVYIAVLPITADEIAGLELDGRGREVDYVVQMRRLPEESALDFMIRAGRLDSTHVEAVVSFFMEHYLNLQPLVISAQDYHQRLIEHCSANSQDLLEHLPQRRHAQVRRIQGAQSRYLALHKDLFLDRVRSGRIIEGHGDLRAEHVYLDPAPIVIDCVEFSTSLRQVDVVDELCFLAMDCERLGRADVGDRLLDAYEQGSGDAPPDSLKAFYKAYRACVRAKVVALRAAGTEDPREKKTCSRQASQFLGWADRHCMNLGPPAVVVVGGLMGTGKSVLARAVADALGTQRLSTDQTRQRLFGSSSSPADYGKEIYQPAQRKQVYEQMLRQAEEVLDDGCSVVLDGTYLTNALRREALQLAHRHGAVPLLVECVCPADVSVSRIQHRQQTGGSDSEARPELYQKQLEEREPVDSSFPAVQIATHTALDAELQTVIDELRARYDSLTLSQRRKGKGSRLR